MDEIGKCRVVAEDLVFRQAQTHQSAGDVLRVGCVDFVQVAEGDTGKGHFVDRVVGAVHGGDYGTAPEADQHQPHHVDDEEHADDGGERPQAATDVQGQSSTVPMGRKLFRN